jgi:hypothetical protein
VDEEVDSVKWILDLLIDKLKKEKTEEWSPEPLWIEDEYPEYVDKEEDEEEKKSVIVIDL